MKAYIIHTPHKKSVEYAHQALKSFEGFIGWDPELFEGLTPEILPNFEKEHPIKTKEKSRAMDYLKGDPLRYVVKKCCSMNHYRLFKKCIELDESIAVVEHDSHCIGNWDNLLFDDILVMNTESAIKQPVLAPIWGKNKKPVESGIRDICFNGLNYRHDPVINGAHVMPGTAAYAVTPAGAKKMIDVYENIGWEQSDFIINTAYVRIQTIMPELFTFKLPNLSTSHGRNML